MNTVKNIYDQIIGRIQQNPAVTLVSAELRPPADETIFGLLENISEQKLPAGLTEFYQQANGLNVSWRTNDDSGITGYIDILKIEQMFTGEFEDLDIDHDLYLNIFDETLVLDFHSDEERETRQKHRMLESHHGQPAYTTVTIENGKLNLWYLDDDKIIGLPMSLNDYLLFLSESMGLDSARHFLQYPEYFENPYAKEPRLELLRKIFPSTDLRNVSCFSQHQ